MVKDKIKYTEGNSITMPIKALSSKVHEGCSMNKLQQLTKHKSPRPYYDKSNVKALLTLAYQKPMRLPSGR